MARISDEQIERLKQDISLQRLAARGYCPEKAPQGLSGAMSVPR